MGIDPSGDDDPFEDPFEDPFADDPLEDSFEDDSFGGGDDGADELEDTFNSIERSTLVAFIVVAVLVHAGLFGASLGVMLIGFRAQWIFGGALTVGGVLALVLGVVAYRRYRSRQ
ncbi:hypothetical protein CV102_06835 [Natronococcus pandeyae]|uniref:DUF7322 domain-containing protein n=1 Tax=Natronococcus pandeyae TaxID=2055836 RepID=A0A8J8Q8W0_9EURY|nr:hypothetical protein [Natronococcus pandeyae]TYL39390.1 hypothetical protein CV102_06835 [Natronococcus pandeyae]